MANNLQENFQYGLDYLSGQILWSDLYPDTGHYKHQKIGRVSALEGGSKLAFSDCQFPSIGHFVEFDFLKKSQEINIIIDRIDQILPTTAQIQSADKLLKRAVLIAEDQQDAEYLDDEYVEFNLASSDSMKQLGAEGYYSLLELVKWLRNVAEKGYEIFNPPETGWLSLADAWSSVNDMHKFAVTYIDRLEALFNQFRSSIDQDIEAQNEIEAILEFFEENPYSASV